MGFNKILPWWSFSDCPAQQSSEKMLFFPRFPCNSKNVKLKSLQNRSIQFSLQVFPFFHSFCNLTTEAYLFSLSKMATRGKSLAKKKKGSAYWTSTAHPSTHNTSEQVYFVSEHKTLQNVSTSRKLLTYSLNAIFKVTVLHWGLRSKWIWSQRKMIHHLKTK